LTFFGVLENPEWVNAGFTFMSPFVQAAVMFPYVEAAAISPYVEAAAMSTYLKVAAISPQC
jgi:hypothetical protein